MPKAINMFKMKNSTRVSVFIFRCICSGVAFLTMADGISTCGLANPTIFELV